MESVGNQTFALAFSDATDPKPVPLGLSGYPSKTAAGEDIFYRKVKVAKAGKWVHRGTGAPVDITTGRLDEWVRNTRALMKAGVRPFIPGQHRERFNAADNLGHVIDLDRDGDDLWAVVQLYGEGALKTAARNSRSVYVVADARDPTGKVHAGESLAHVAAVPNPALSYDDLGHMEPADPAAPAGTVRVAADAGGPAVYAPVLELPGPAELKPPPPRPAHSRAALALAAALLGVPAVRSAAAVRLALAGGNCGTGAGGFAPNNTCAKGGGGSHNIAPGDHVMLPGAAVPLRVTKVDRRGMIYAADTGAPAGDPGTYMDRHASEARKVGAGGGAAPDIAAPGHEPLPQFAAAVQRAADAADAGGFGDNKVFIGHAYRRYVAGGGEPAGLPAFKARLIEARRAGLLTLSRADLPAAMDPADVAESRTEYLNSESHFVLAAPKARHQGERGPVERLAAAPAPGQVRDELIRKGHVVGTPAERKRLGLSADGPRSAAGRRLLELCGDAACAACEAAGCDDGGADDVDDDYVPDPTFLPPEFLPDGLALSLAADAGTLCRSAASARLVLSLAESHGGGCTRWREVEGEPVCVDGSANPNRLPKGFSTGNPRPGAGKRTAAPAQPPATENQVNALHRFGVAPRHTAGLDKGTASALIGLMSDAAQGDKFARGRAGRALFDVADRGVTDSLVGRVNAEGPHAVVSDVRETRTRDNAAAKAYHEKLKAEQQATAKAEGEAEAKHEAEAPARKAAAISRVSEQAAAEIAKLEAAGMTWDDDGNDAPRGSAFYEKLMRSLADRRDNPHKYI